MPGGPFGPGQSPQRPAQKRGAPANELDSLLNKPTLQDRLKTEKGEELLELIAKPTAKENAVVKRFKTEGGSQIREYCPHLTKDDCRRAHASMFPCHRVHFRRLVFPWTDVSMGNCSYLDTCRHMKTCRYVHYELDDEPDLAGPVATDAAKSRPPVPAYLAVCKQFSRGSLDARWIKCDIRTFDMTVLGKFGVIMADPPWEIHQDLPYGTMADDEMRKLNIGTLQDEGVIFLWVTGRAMELGRECLEIWGYKRVDELIWVKTNQLQRLIRTGRTGHWLNHSKEHCLVGVKGSPNINRSLDCDVLVGEVRETSRKPDEMYSLLERLSPGTRKVEIFARQHNVQPGWVCLGNQLNGVVIREPEMLERYEAKYGPVPAPSKA
ncbi:MT-A70-domain-containing protein [Coccomyxa subellipsoidea C-169]|uniref:MT-A70-domain-containing protein n=1 Tax=Coccomyxa subellipsoidea (strain C-169) TaxID=574566 RepID=I0Z3D1_COCSC|nr:MT-A70-domain-containing protein [Coccomyxa subellipsoidea C-169]EIE25150.1 MT-A70-domain-containing protein [Coccomyxa subellipsoidea C-169]|eukprot:XP_005649694.1 MT-A70-domain-containing protein [Coccomyxa subellipsoidea C-169]